MTVLPSSLLCAYAASPGLIIVCFSHLLHGLAAFLGLMTVPLSTYKDQHVSASLRVDAFAARS